MPANFLSLMDVAKVTELAGVFRDAIERTDKRQLTICFRDFPAGSCGDTAYLLGRYLAENGMGEWTYALGLGYRPDGSWSHAWIEQDGWIVDITADQFPAFTDKVIVTQKSDFHAGLERNMDVTSDYRDFGEGVANEYERDYQVILRSI